jgi:hypothetical protein
MLTVHASKGLEFRAAYLPALGRTMFPVNPQWSPCPPPAGMLAEHPKDSHEEEEECLFFVAMSRARDLLCLSRAERYGMARKASPLLIQLASHLPQFPEAAASWREPGPAGAVEPPLAHLAPDIEVHAAEDLDQYMRCPRAYLYQRVLGLSGGREDNAYVRFHRAVYTVLRWIAGSPAETPVSIGEALERLARAWDEIGPADHPYAPVYWEAARSIVERAVGRRSGAETLVEADWEIVRAAGRIRVKPDHVEMTSGGPIVRRLRTGRPPKNIDDDIYALYHLGARQAFGGARVEALFLTTDETVPVGMTDRVIGNRVEKYDAAIAGILAGHFPPKPDDRTCPRCPQYFICPGLPEPGAAD